MRPACRERTQNHAMTHTTMPCAHAVTCVRFKRCNPYDVLRVARDGSTPVFKRYKGQASL